MQEVRRNVFQSMQSMCKKGESLKVFLAFLLAVFLFSSCEKEPDIQGGGKAFTSEIQAGVEGLPDSVKAVFLLENLPSFNLPEDLKEKLSERNPNPLGLFFLGDTPLKEWERIVIGVSPSSSSSSLDWFVFLEVDHSEKEIVRFFEDQWGELTLENLKGFTSFSTQEPGFKMALLQRKFLLVSNQLEMALDVVRKDKSNIQTQSEFSLYQKELTAKNPFLWGIILTQNVNLSFPNALKFLQQYQQTVSSLLFSILYKESDSLFEMELDTVIQAPEKTQEFLFLYQLALGFLESHVQRNYPELESTLKRVQLEPRSDRVRISFSVKEDEIRKGLESQLLSR